MPRDPSTGFQGGGGDIQQSSNNTGLPQTMVATAQVPAPSSTSTTSSTAAGMISLRGNLSENNTTGMNMSGAENRMTGQQNDTTLNNRVLNTQNIGTTSIGHSQQVIDFRNANNTRPQGKSPRISNTNIRVYILPNGYENVNAYNSL